VYERVIQAVAETPWAIRPSILATIREVLEMRARGERFTPEEIRARLGEPDPWATARGRNSQSGSVAVIGVWGSILPRARMLNDVSGPGGTSIEEFRTLFRSAMADPNVGSILLDVDSPGGSAAQVPEMADEIRRSRGSKPIVAIANTQAASAAYWLASQADEIVASPSAFVGSIGVWTAHEDLSAALEMEGVKMTLVASTPEKVEGNPFEALSEDARADMQSVVDEFYGLFLRDVAKGRGVSTGTVREEYGKGRQLTAQRALKAGMIDRVATFDDTVRRLASGQPVGRRAVAQADAYAQLGEDLARGMGEPDAADVADEGIAVEDVSDDSPDEPQEIVPGAEQLLRRPGVREAFGASR